MKGSKKNRLSVVVWTAFVILSVGLILTIPDWTMAQDLPPGLLDKPQQSPIDGGLGILAALGGAYAIKKLRDKQA